MSNVYFNLAGGDFFQDWSNTGLITADDNWAGVPSITGYLGDIDSGSTSDVDPRTLTGANLGTVDVIANQTSTTITNGGVAEFQIANPVVALQGSGAADAPSLVLNLDATGRENLHLTALIRDIDVNDNAVQQFNIQYRTSPTGTWTNLPGGYFADVTSAGATQTTAVDINLPASLANSSQLQIRFMTTNAGSSDEWVGVDDIRVTSTPINGGGTGSTFSVNDVAVVEGDGGGETALTFTVSRTGTGDASVDYSFTLPGGIGGADAGDFAVAPVGGTVSFTGTETTKLVTLRVRADDIVEPTETFTINLANASAGSTIADAQGTGTIASDDLGITKIHDIQGTAFFSPILAAEGITAFNQASAAQVTISGVVTAVDSFAGSGTLGFYVSEETADWDNDGRTSEGIYVRVSSLPTGLVVGETVTLTANVMEFQAFSNLNRTMLVNPMNIVQGNDQVALPTLVLDGTPGKHIPNQIISDDNPNFFLSADGAGDSFDPENDALDFYETIEGMRVTIPNMVVADGFVGGTNDNFVYFNAYSTNHADADLINSRGGYTITGDPQRYPVDTADPNDDVKFGGATVHDGAQHGDILELDFGDVGRGGASGFDQDLTMGDSLGNVSGIIDFDFGVTKFYVTDALDPTKVAGLAGNTPIQEVTTLSGDDRALRVATFNVENLSPVGTTFSTNNGVEITTEAKFDKLAANIATNLKSPDIIIVEEVQDNNGVTQDGVTDASTTWNYLVAKVNAATGKVYQWVDEAPTTSGDVGGAPGGNIRVGFLYDTGRVQLGNLAADASLADRRKFVDRVGDGVRDAGDLIAVDDSGLGINPADWSGTRRSLLGEFHFNGQTIYAMGSHLPSKGGSDDPYEINQNNALGQPANGDWALRNTLAQDVWQVQNRVNQTIADAKLVSGGDFNEFWFNRPLEVLTGYANPDGSANTTGTKYSNLMVDKLAEVDRFSYDFDGRSEALDSIISDQALAGVASYDVVHINTGYNDRAGANNPSSSDHDPSLASFDFRSFAETLNGTANNDSIQGFGGNDSINGLGGTDTVVFVGNRADYVVTQVEGGFQIADTVAGRDGTDTVRNVELFQFADVTVNADSFNNDAPTDLTLLGGIVTENAPPGTTVAVASATDPDMGDVLTYSLSDDAGGRFVIEAATGVVRIAPGMVIDREEAAAFGITVVATDQGGLSVARAFSIAVNDVDEFDVTAPADADAAPNQVAENAATGTLVGLTARAVDGDATTSAVTYALANDAGGRFAIDAQTGVVTVANGALINYEVAQSHTIVVAATSADGSVANSSFVIGVTNTAETQFYVGTNGNDTFSTTSIDNYIVDARAGNDVITTGDGNDSYVAGIGNDTYNLGGGDDIVTFKGAAGANGYESIDGGAGFDELRALQAGTVISLHSVTGVEKVGSGGFANVSIAGSTAADTLDFTGATLAGITQVKLGGGNDLFLGSLSNDTILGEAGNDTMTGAEGDDTFLIGLGSGWDSIDGGAGFDTIRATAINTKIGIASVTGVEAIDGGGFANVTIVGTTGNDTINLTGITATGIAAIDAGTGNDTIRGSDSADVIKAGLGTDILTGNGGADVFDFDKPLDSRSGGAFDTITDFTRGEDLIDLSTIDANTKVANNQAFTLIGSDSFHRIAGELRYDLSVPGATKVFGDVNGDGVADFEIQLTGQHNLTASDFVL